MADKQQKQIILLLFVIFGGNSVASTGECRLLEQLSRELCVALCLQPSAERNAVLGLPLWSAFVTSATRQITMSIPLFYQSNSTAAVGPWRFQEASFKRKVLRRLAESRGSASGRAESQEGKFYWSDVSRWYLAAGSRANRSESDVYRSDAKREEEAEKTSGLKVPAAPEAVRSAGPRLSHFLFFYRGWSSEKN